MRTLLRYLAADYARSRIENVTCLLLPLIVAVPVIAVVFA